jgi:hypothetical protein
MKQLVVNYSYGGKYDCGCEGDFGEIDFSSALYNKIKKYYKEHGETFFDDILESNILTPKQQQELENMYESLKEEIIETDDSWISDEEDYCPSTPDQWYFSFWVETPEDWDE